MIQIKKIFEVFTFPQVISYPNYNIHHFYFCLDDTYTYYINPINQINDPEIYDSKNQVGKITLFQNNIPHFTNEHKIKKERITIAFDLSLKKHSENYLKII